MPGNDELETRLRHYVRWNAMAMVVRANKVSSELGGHVASFASAATLYDVGFNHFWRAPSDSLRRRHGLLARPQRAGHLRARVSRRPHQRRAARTLPPRSRRRRLAVVSASVAHAGLLAISDGLDGPRAPSCRSIRRASCATCTIAASNDTAGRKVWAFVGDGETDEPETLGAISLAGREKLDNLIWVINCNLQRLDGPVRGNGKIIQELERVFNGAGWNVIKVIWGSRWDRAAADATRPARLVQLMNETRRRRLSNVQIAQRQVRARRILRPLSGNGRRSSRIGPTTRFGRCSAAATIRAKSTPRIKRRSNTTGQPTVILAKTIKGYGMGEAGEAHNIAHQAKKMEVEEMRAFRDRFRFRSTTRKSKRSRSTGRRKTAGDEVSARASRTPRQRFRNAGRKSESLAVPELSAFDAQLKGTGEREISTTMAFVRILNTIARDAALGPRIVPIVADESRTFGMEGMFRQLGIYSSVGQLYHPQDAEQLMWYREDKHGQILQEGINEAGAISSWIAAGTSYSNHDLPMIPFYIFYSMFGFQRVGDLAWAAGGFAHARILARRHVGTHDAQRRRAATRRRPQPSLRFVHSELPQLRSDVRLRSRRHHPRRLAPHADAIRKTSTTTSRCSTKTTRIPICPQAPKSGILAACISSATAARPRRKRRACSCWAPAQFCAKSIAAATCSRRLERAERRLERARASTSCSATASIRSAGTCCIRKTKRELSLCRADAGRSPRTRRSPRPITSARTRIDSSVRRGPPLRYARHRRLRPQRLPRRSCASSSK